MDESEMPFDPKQLMGLEELGYSSHITPNQEVKGIGCKYIRIWLCLLSFLQNYCYTDREA